VSPVVEEEYTARFKRQNADVKLRCRSLKQEESPRKKENQKAIEEGGKVKDSQLLEFGRGSLPITVGTIL